MEGHLQSLSESLEHYVRRAMVLLHCHLQRKQAFCAWTTNTKPGLEFFQELVSLGGSLEGSN